jgi:predicted NBD/HSP70 family sugar kinase
MQETNSFAQGLLSDPVTQDPNLRRVLRLIWKNEGIPRTDVAKGLGLHKSTVTKIVTQLLEGGIVYEGAEGEAKKLLGGRKPIELRIRGDFGAFLGIEILPDRYRACLLDPLGAILSTAEAGLSYSGRDLHLVALEAIADARKRLAISSTTLLGVGLGLSGIIDSERGVVRRSLPLGVGEPVHIRGSTAEPSPRIENDARCCCWAELVRNRGILSEDFMFLLGEFRQERAGELPAGIGVGMALVIDGAVHRGTDGRAGEFRSVFRREDTRSQFSLPDKVIRLAATEAEDFSRVARELGMNLGLIVNLLDLRRVVIGGNFERWRTVLAATLAEEIESNRAYPGKARCEVSFSSFGDNIVAYGAASMLISRLFAEPPVGRKRAPGADGFIPGLGPGQTPPPLRGTGTSGPSGPGGG